MDVICGLQDLITYKEELRKESKETAPLQSGTFDRFFKKETKNILV